jgi:hypothetical protein
MKNQKAGSFAGLFVFESHTTRTVRIQKGKRVITVCPIHHSSRNVNSFHAP